MNKAEIVQRIEALTADQLTALESYLKTIGAPSDGSRVPVDQRAQRVLETFGRVRERIRREHGLVDVSSSIREQRRARP